jgi:hypothetical protein
MRKRAVVGHRLGVERKQISDFCAEGEAIRSRREVASQMLIDGCSRLQGEHSHAMDAEVGLL